MPNAIGSCQSISGLLLAFVYIRLARSRLPACWRPPLADAMHDLQVAESGYKEVALVCTLRRIVESTISAQSARFKSGSNNHIPSFIMEEAWD